MKNYFIFYIVFAFTVFKKYFYIKNNSSFISYSKQYFILLLFLFENYCAKKIIDV